MHSATSSPTEFVPKYLVRKMVARGFSEMYGGELPEYNRFTAPVRESNLAELPKHPEIKRETLMEEKHGAIRVQGPIEMRIVTRIFAQMGMAPVEFYDMTILGAKSLPMIATAFRPIDKSIDESAFRMFCSMLHVGSIPPVLKMEVLAALDENRRRYPKFSAELMALLDKAECKGGLDEADAKLFVTQVVDAFSMHKDKIVDFGMYSKLRKLSDPLADIVLESPVLNHLTPRALDIRDAVKRLVESDIPMQTVIQGPPIREDGESLQLNQIARIAAGEDVYVSNDVEVLRAFADNPQSLSDLKTDAPRIELAKDEKVADYMARIEEALKSHKVVIVQHKARFGEIESRGVALTLEGELAYNAYAIESEIDPEIKKSKLARFKEEYPKSHQQLHKKGFAYYTYEVTEAGRAANGQLKSENLDFNALIDRGYVSLVPQTYNDFLPFSAAAIFTANLTTGTEGIGEGERKATNENRAALEAAMGVPITSRHEIHRRAQEESLWEVSAVLARH